MDVSTPLNAQLNSLFHQYIATPYSELEAEPNWTPTWLDDAVKTNDTDLPTPTVWPPVAPMSPPTTPTIITVSESFPSAVIAGGLSPDVVLVSLDNVCFYVHSAHIIPASTNGFANLLGAPFFARTPSADTVPVPIPEPSETLSLILHAVYNKPCPLHPLAAVCRAVDALPTYGLSPAALVAPGTPLFAQLRAHAPADALAVYSLAGAHDLHALAVCASAHLHTLHLHSLDDDDAARMGARYLRRLFFMHLGRTHALKRLLLAPPAEHARSPMCSEEARRTVRRAWALGTAYISWGARPDVTAQEIRTTLSPLAKDVQCTLCKLAFAERINDLVTQWANVNPTIYL